MLRTTVATPSAESRGEAVQGAAVSMARIGTLDVLRGIALLGMFLVHLNNYADGTAASALSTGYQKVVALFMEERFWTMFGILFGVGFAVQLRRAEARGGSFAPIYLRRLLALAGFGCLAHAVFGYNVLLGYAAWGLPLLLVRRWPIRRLVIVLVLSAASWSLFSIARVSVRVAAIGEAAYLSEAHTAAASAQAFRESNSRAQDAAKYSAVFRARLQHMAWFYAQPFSFLPMNTFTLFLLGVIGLRLGLFDHPDQHRRLIVTLMVFGAASWAAETWLLPIETPPGGPLVRSLIVGRLANGFGLVRGMWLAFVYIGAVLLLVARNPAWVQRLRIFSWPGRMALTSYMVQIAILDLSFSNYALHLQLTPLAALGAGLALFVVCAACSRWWLTRYRFGPLEWLWRSITYGRPQPWRIETAAASPAAELAGGAAPSALSRGADL